MRKLFLPLILALAAAAFAAPIKFQSFDESFVKLERGPKDAWNITVEIDHGNLHFVYTGQVRSILNNKDLRVGREDIEFAVGYYDNPTVVDGENMNFEMAEMVAVWDVDGEDEALLFTNGVFKALPPYDQNPAVTAAIAAGAAQTAEIVKTRPLAKWSRTYEKQIDASRDDVWNKQELAEAEKAKKKEAALAAKLAAEKAAQEAEQARADSIAAAKAKKKSKKKHEADSLAAAQAAAEAAAAEEAAAEEQAVPTPEEAAKDAVETESSKPSFGGGKHIIPNETLRVGLAGSLLAIGCASAVLAIIEMQNKKASQELLDANNAMGNVNGLSGAFESQVNKHKTNMIMGGAAAVLGLGGAFFIYKF